MNQKDYDATQAVFKELQEKSLSPLLQKATVRKFGGSREREIKTLHILLSTSVRPRQRIPVYVWMEMVCTRWNEALFQVTAEAGESFNRFVLDNKTVSIEVQGSTLKVSANMVEAKS